MIVYVPGRMPSHVSPYGAARYPGLLTSNPGYYRPVSTYLTNLHNHQHNPSYQHYPTSSVFSNLNFLQQPLDLPVWPHRMPAEEELATLPAGRIGLGASPSGLASGGPPSPAHSDSDASNSSLELGSVRSGENAQLKCRWRNCGRWFASLKQLADHVARLHAAPGKSGLFYCGWEECPRGERGFNARYKMLVHVRTHTNEKPHHCFQCDKSFSRAENLKIHARSHTGERPYQCPVKGCNKAYSNSSDRFKHTRTHAVDKPYCCKVPGCPKRYTDPSSLRKHVKTYRHYINNNDKVQEKSFEENSSSQDKSSTYDVTPDKNSSISTGSDKKDSSIESTTSLTSPKASYSFEEQRKFVEWNNMYNLQDRKEQDQVTPPKNNYDEAKIYPRIFDDSFRTPERLQHPHHHQHHTNIFSGHPIKDRSNSSSSPQTSPQHIPDGSLSRRIGMQSTPIKVEEMSDCQTKVTVDYRNIESIVNSTPCKKENNPIIRHSVIKRADNIKMDISENTKPDDIKESTCCCRHKCCVHNESLLQNTKLLSDLIMKSQNPLFRQLLGSVDLRYEFQNMWSNIGTTNDHRLGQDLRIKSTQGVTEMEQDFPLDLTIHK